MKRAPFIGIITLLLVCCVASAQEDVKITFKVKVPAGTPVDAKVYLAGDAKALGEWKAEGLLLKKGEDGVYSVIALLPKDKPIEYKVTRGSWETVEKNADGSEINNRTLTPTKDASVEVEVKKWADSGAADAKPPAEKKSTRSGDIRAHAKFHSQNLNNDRDILVYLPPRYDQQTDRRYPVLYLHDGQNVFDAATSFAGEWQADETAERLIAEKKIEPLIIVAIANNKDRMAEYTPWADAKHGGGNGDAYARFVADEVKPFIDSTYRTRTTREDTAVGGSSLGALVSLHIATKYPDRFGKIAALSPALWWNNSAMLHESMTFPPHTKIWLDAGTEEGQGVVDAVQKLADSLHGQDVKVRIVDGARHNETAWAKRFDQVLLFLFPAV
jgi:predicted alpha/beta superfamily hydrolase